MDRRIKRTRTAVFNAVLELMIEKETDKITVLELCKKADINKSTFYLHYKNIDECLQRCFQIIMDEVINLSKMVNYNELKVNPKPWVDKLLNEIEKNTDYIAKFKASNICGPSIKLLKESLVKSICDNNNINMTNNYYEVCNIAFSVGGCVDAVMISVPNFNKEELSRSICNMLISK